MEKVKGYSISLVISFVIVAVFLTISACIFAYTNINDRYLDSFVFGTVMFSVLIGSIILAKKIKEKGIIYGGLYGLLFCLIIYAITCIEYTGFFVSNTLFIYLGISFLSGVVGGIIGVNV